MDDYLPTIPGLDNALESVLAAKARAEANGALDEFFTHRVGGLALANFVFQGGGILGIAHLGFLHGLEQAGVRCAGVAGTSAGAILALLICAGRSSFAAPIAQSLVPVLWRMPAKSFIDGPYRVRRIVKYALSKDTSASAEMLLPAFSALKRIKRTHGLNPGNAFYSWLANVLAKRFEISTVAELDRKLTDAATYLNKVLASSNVPDVSPKKLLKIIATGLPQAAASKSMGIKIIFPDNANLFSSAYAHHSPALFARASMSIPLFFEPFDLTLEPELWRRWLAIQYSGVLSNTAMTDIGAATSIAFVDGGLLSNFPIDSFLHAADCGRLSLLPTIGVALAGEPKEHDRIRPGSTASAIRYLLGVIDGMRHVRDRDGKNLARIFDDAKKELHVSVALVDIGSHNWLNFQLETSDMADLYLRGVETAAKFLDGLRSSNQ